jgi:DNA-binding response OmpR family regulator
LPTGKILLVTPGDESYRGPLLAAEGYAVALAHTLAAARQILEGGACELVLVTTDEGILTVFSFCEQLKILSPRTRTAILARWSEYVPQSDFVDAVIRMQYSPAKFLAAVKTLIGAAGARD